MQELYIEGVATHNGPELCGYAGNSIAEALTRVCAGWVVSREKSCYTFGVPTLSQMSEGNTVYLITARG